MEFACELQRNPDFPDADGMKPDPTASDSRHGFGRKDSEALESLVGISSTFQDPQEISRQEDQEDREEQQVVEEKGDPSHGERRRIRMRDSP